MFRTLAQEIQTLYLHSSKPGGVLCVFKVPQSALQVRYLSGEQGGGRRGFLGEFLDNLKQELNKNKEMKENIKKFREEAKKLEESEALKQARRKYVSIWPQAERLSLKLAAGLKTLGNALLVFS